MNSIGTISGQIYTSTSRRMPLGTAPEINKTRELALLPRHPKPYLTVAQTKVFLAGVRAGYKEGYKDGYERRDDEVMAALT